jgi:HK97 family phage major capsid protein
MQNDPRELDPDLRAKLDVHIDLHERHLFWLQQQRQLVREQGDRRQVCLLARAIGSMCEGGLSGPERAFFEETARQAGQTFDPQRVVLPWWALNSRDLTAANAAAGGYLVGTSATSVRDTLAPFSATLGAGMSTVEGLRDTVSVPKTATDPTISWMATEASQASPSTPALASTALVPKTAIGVIQVSRQLWLQADAETYVRRLLTRTAAAIVDQAALNGSGVSGQPLGVLNATGLSTQSGTSLAWSGVLAMKGKAAAKNATESAIAFISTPAVRELLEGRERASGGGQFIWQDGKIAACSAFATTNMPTATMLSGPMSEILFGLWGVGLQIEVNPFDATLFKSGVRQVRVAVTCDVAIVGEAAAFTKSTSIT